MNFPPLTGIECQFLCAWFLSVQKTLHLVWQTMREKLRVECWWSGWLLCKHERGKVWRLRHVLTWNLKEKRRCELLNMKTTTPLVTSLIKPPHSRQKIPQHSISCSTPSFINYCSNVSCMRGNFNFNSSVNWVNHLLFHFPTHYLNCASLFSPTVTSFISLIKPRVAFCASNLQPEREKTKKRIHNQTVFQFGAARRVIAALNVRR